MLARRRYSIDARSFGTALSQGGVPKAATDLHMAELYHGGEGESTKRQLADALKVFDAFRDSSDELKELYPQLFNQLGADVLWRSQRTRARRARWRSAAAAAVTAPTKPPPP